MKTVAKPEAKFSVLEDGVFIPREFLESLQDNFSYHFTYQKSFIAIEEEDRTNDSPVEIGFLSEEELSENSKEALKEMEKLSDSDFVWRS